MKLLNKDEFLANELRYYLIKEDIKYGDKLPTERELAEQYGVQRATVRSAYKILEEEGLIEIRGRSGRYMGHPRILVDLRQIKSFSKKLSDMGMRTENQMLVFELVEVDKALCKKIKLPLGTVLNKITRVRKVFLEKEVFPVAIEYAYVPEQVAKKLNKFDLEEQSLFEVLSQEYGRIPDREEQIIEIVYANEFESKVLQVNKMTELVMKEGITYDKNGEVIQFLHAVMKKEWMSFEQRNTQIEERMKEV